MVSDVTFFSNIAKLLDSSILFHFIFFYFQVVFFVITLSQLISIICLFSKNWISLLTMYIHLTLQKIRNYNRQHQSITYYAINHRHTTSQKLDLSCNKYITQNTRILQRIDNIEITGLTNNEQYIIKQNNSTNFNKS